MSSTMKQTWDLIVIGAGILGTAHAYYAAKRGWRVLLLERGDWPGEASVRNFGTLMAGSLSGEWRRRGMESIALYRELSAQAGFDFFPCGSLYQVTTSVEADVLAEFAERAPQEGCRCELLEPAHALALNPFLETKHVRLALFFPDDARVEPRGLFRRLIPWLTRELAVEYRPGTVAVDVRAKDGEACIRTADGVERRARHAVVCTGSELRTLFPERYRAAGFERCKLLMLRIAPQPRLRMPTTLASGLTLRRYPAFAGCPSWARLNEEPAAPGVLEAGIHILTVQDPDGSFVVGDSHQYGAGDFNDVLDARLEALLLAEARKLMSLPSWEIAERWHGIYGMAKDAEIYRASIDGVIHIVTGIRGKGMTTGPAVAREIIETLACDPT
ncbi:MAG TPA: TIGR03364 family FAD-dependent oxidoreductase [Gemmataceae bacterium]|nr:TIGR03364 family FAD-dependent oxidoreductase [Gemmataceae bacterium]